MVKKIKEAPEGVKILAFVYFAGALALMILGITAFSLADSVRSADPSALAAANLSQSNFGVILTAGIFLVLFAILEYFVGKGILEAKDWARMFMGLLSFISFVLAIRSLFNGMYASSLSGIALNGLILWYLFFKDSTKKFFK